MFSENHSVLRKDIPQGLAVTVCVFCNGASICCNAKVEYGCVCVTSDIANFVKQARTLPISKKWAIVLPIF